MATWLILGCGYTGSRLAERLIISGETIVATTRRQERQRELASRLGDGANIAVTSLETSDAVAAVTPAGAIAVISFPPSSSDGGPERIVSDALASAGASRLIYLSSTGVYGRGVGTWTDEDTSTGPLGERGERRLAAETAVLESSQRSGLSAVSLRIAGIYGPGRGVHARLARGDYRIYGQGSAQVSRIHVDDLVTAIVCAGRAQPLVRSLYCIADDEPTSSRDHADGLAALMNLPPPPSVPTEEASEAARAMLGANRRISNRRAKAELGLTLNYPSWREGAAALASP